MSRSGDKVVADYIRDVEVALRDLPRSRREEIVGEIRGHLSETLGNGEATEADARNAIDELGSPDEIAREAGARVQERPSVGGKEVAALLLLPFGALLFSLGWIVGVALLWSSAGWTSKEKLAGTLLPPGGLAFPLLLMFFSIEPESCRSVRGDGSGMVMECTDGLSTPGEILLVTAIVASVILALGTPIWLLLRLRRRASRG